MALTAGTRLGPYEILAPIGAGGMGQVYRARDTRLDRDVAVKVLPELFARDADRRARFEREAKAVAALSHPNILAIHDIGDVDGQTFVVTELLEGETLRERLTRGPLPLRKTIDVAAQILRGLAAAHDKGIVHRDLKPDNVFLLADGQVKILDFGLARQTLASSGATETAVMTDPGTILGTMGYMAPEQVRGQAIDPRTDLFAFGAVLYEMLSGTRAFARDTAADTMSAVLNDDPPELTGSRADLSPALDRIVRHCLEKNPRERFQSARDVAFAIEALSGSATTAARAAADLPRRRRWVVPVLASVGVVVVAVSSYWLGRRAVPPVSGTATHVDTKTFDPQSIFNARFAPDGKTIVYSSALEGTDSELFVLRPGGVLPEKIGHPHTHLLSVSSKGELAVLTDATYIGQRLFLGTLARTTMDGEPRPMTAHVREADWAPDGETLAITRMVKGVDRVEYPIGTVLYETHGYVSDPRVSPDGTRVAFMDHQSRYDDRGWVKTVDRAKHVQTLAGEYWGEEGLAWSSDGRSLYFSAAIVSGTESYQPIVVAADGRTPAREALSSVGAVLLMDIAAHGRWLVLRQDTVLSIRAVTAGGPDEREFPWLNNAVEGYLSRDGKTLVFGDESQGAGPTYAVAMRRTDGSPAVRLGAGAATAISPDGRWAVGFVSTPPKITAYPTGVGDPVTFNHGNIVRYDGSAAWFPDSRRLVACGNEANAPERCYIHDLSGAPPVPIGPAGASDLTISPDGKSMEAYVNSTVQVGPVSGGALVPVPGYPDGFYIAGWSNDGRSLFIADESVPARLERIDIATGKRTFVRELAPPDRSGLTQIAPVEVVDDGRYYAYGYSKRLTTLFVVSGVR